MYYSCIRRKLLKTNILSRFEQKIALFVIAISKTIYSSQSLFSIRDAREDYKPRRICLNHNEFMFTNIMEVRYDSYREKELELETGKF